MREVKILSKFRKHSWLHTSEARWEAWARFWSWRWVWARAKPRGQRGNSQVSCGRSEEQKWGAPEQCVTPALLQTNYEALIMWEPGLKMVAILWEAGVVKQTGEIPCFSAPKAGHHCQGTFTEEKCLLPCSEIVLNDQSGVRRWYFCFPEVPPDLLMPSQSKKATTGSRGSKFQTNPAQTWVIHRDGSERSPLKRLVAWRASPQQRLEKLHRVILSSEGFLLSWT